MEGRQAPGTSLHPTLPTPQISHSYLSDLERLVTPATCPRNRMWLRSRVKTTGIIETQFLLRDLNFGRTLGALTCSGGGLPSSLPEACWAPEVPALLETLPLLQHPTGREVRSLRMPGPSRVLPSQHQEARDARGRPPGDFDARVSGVTAPQDVRWAGSAQSARSGSTASRG